MTQNRSFTQCLATCIYRKLRVFKQILFYTAFMFVVFMTAKILFGNNFEDSQGPHKYKPVKVQQSSGLGYAYNNNPQSPKVPPNHCKVYAPDSIEADSSFKKALLHTPSGNLYIYAYNDSDLISRTIRQQDTWDAESIVGMSRLLAKHANMHLIDLGASIGVYTFTAAKAGRLVVALEPNLDNLRRIRLGLLENRLSSQVVLLHNALSDKRQPLAMPIVRDNVGGSSAVEPSKNFTAVTEAILMDDLLEVIAFKSAVLKIDIELWEFRAFQSARKLFDAVDFKVVLMEWSVPQYRNRTMAAYLYDFFISRGYEAYSSFMSDVRLPEDFMTWRNDIVWRAIRPDVYTPERRPGDEQLMVVDVPIPIGSASILAYPSSRANSLPMIKQWAASHGIWRENMLRLLHNLYLDQTDLNLIDLGGDNILMALSAGLAGRRVICVDSNHSSLHLLGLALTQEKNLAVQKDLPKLVTLIHNAVRAKRGYTLINPSGPFEKNETLEAGSERWSRRIRAILLDDLVDLMSPKRFEAAVLYLVVDPDTVDALVASTRLFTEKDIRLVATEWSTSVMSNATLLTKVYGLFTQQYHYEPYHTTTPLVSLDAFITLVSKKKGNILWWKQGYQVNEKKDSSKDHEM